MGLMDEHTHTYLFRVWTLTVCDFRWEMVIYGQQQWEDHKSTYFDSECATFSMYFYLYFLGHFGLYTLGSYECYDKDEICRVEIGGRVTMGWWSKVESPDLDLVCVFYVWFHNQTYRDKNRSELFFGCKNRIAGGF